MHHDNPNGRSGKRGLVKTVVAMSGVADPSILLMQQEYPGWAQTQHRISV